MANEPMNPVEFASWFRENQLAGNTTEMYEQYLAGYDPMVYSESVGGVVPRNDNLPPAELVAKHINYAGIEAGPQYSRPTEYLQSVVSSLGGGMLAAGVPYIPPSGKEWWMEQEAKVLANPDAKTPVAAVSSAIAVVDAVAAPLLGYSLDAAGAMSVAQLTELMGASGTSVSAIMAFLGSLGIPAAVLAVIGAIVSFLIGRETGNGVYQSIYYRGRKIGAIQGVIVSHGGGKSKYRMIGGNYRQ